MGPDGICVAQDGLLDYGGPVCASVMALVQSPEDFSTKKAKLVTALLKTPGCCSELAPLGPEKATEVLEAALAQASTLGKLHLLQCMRCPVTHAQSGIDPVVLATSWYPEYVGVSPIYFDTPHTFTEVYSGGVAYGSPSVYTLMNSPDCGLNSLALDVNGRTQIVAWDGPVGVNDHPSVATDFWGDNVDSHGSSIAVYYTSIRQTHLGNRIIVAASTCGEGWAPVGTTPRHFIVRFDLGAYPALPIGQVEVAAGRVRSIVEDPAGNVFFTVDNQSDLYVIGAGKGFVTSGNGQYYSNLMPASDPKVASVAYDRALGRLLFRRGSTIYVAKSTPMAVGGPVWDFSASFPLEVAEGMVRDFDVLGGLIVATVQGDPVNFVGIFDCYGKLVAAHPFLDPWGVEFLADKHAVFEAGDGAVERRFVVSGRRTPLSTDLLHEFRTSCDPFCTRFTLIDLPIVEQVPGFPGDLLPSPTPGPSAGWEWMRGR